MKQRLEIRKLLIPELTQSLKILSLPLLDLKNLVEQSLMDNPFLEEESPAAPSINLKQESFKNRSNIIGPDQDFKMASISQKTSLQDILMRQLGMFANTDEDLKIGEEIIGNIDENGYLKASIEEISQALGVLPEKVEICLKLVQQFEPFGVAARTLSECLLIQLDLTNELDPLLRKIAECHLEDVAKKNYRQIAKALNELPEKIELLIKKLLKLNPKPGSSYSQHTIQHVIPDVIIFEKDENFEASINDEDIPSLKISEAYKNMLKANNLNPQDKEFLTQKLAIAQELQRALSKRKFTLRKIVEAIMEVQKDAIRENLASLLPLTYQEIANKLDIHESTVCRAVMNKYVELPYCTVALKDFFPSQIRNTNGQAISSTHTKSLIKGLIENEDKKHPLSDQQIFAILFKEENLTLARRTIAKYREELKIPSTTFRREH